MALHIDPTGSHGFNRFSWSPNSSVRAMEVFRQAHTKLILAKANFITRFGFSNVALLDNVVGGVPPSVKLLLKKGREFTITCQTPPMAMSDMVATLRFKKAAEGDKFDYFVYDDERRGTVLEKGVPAIFGLDSNGSVNLLTKYPVKGTFALTYEGEGVVLLESMDDLGVTLKYELVAPPDINPADVDLLMRNNAYKIEQLIGSGEWKWSIFATMPEKFGEGSRDFFKIYLNVYGVVMGCMEEKINEDHFTYYIERHDGGMIKLMSPSDDPENDLSFYAPPKPITDIMVRTINFYGMFCARKKPT